MGPQFSCVFSNFYFPDFGQAVDTGVVPFPPPGSCLPILSRIGFSNPTARRYFIFADSRSRAFRKSIGAQEKVPTNLHECALGGARTHETDLYQARG